MLGFSPPSRAEFGGFGDLTRLIAGGVLESDGLFVRFMGYGVCAGDPLTAWGVGGRRGLPPQNLHSLPVLSYTYITAMLQG